jgi:hypothetical protein
MSCPNGWLILFLLSLIFSQMLAIPHAQLKKLVVPQNEENFRFEDTSKY